MAFALARNVTDDQVTRGRCRLRSKTLGPERLEHPEPGVGVLAGAKVRKEEFIQN